MHLIMSMISIYSLELIYLIFDRPETSIDVAGNETVNVEPPPTITDPSFVKRKKRSNSDSRNRTLEEFRSRLFSAYIQAAMVKVRAVSSAARSRCFRKLLGLIESRKLSELFLTF